MNTAEILKHVDHTLLKPIATWEDIQKIFYQFKLEKI